MTETFADLGAPDDLVRALDQRGIRTPFPVQRLTMAAGCAGRDLAAQAPTGSGKTIAFGVPLVARLTAAAPSKPTGLVLVPTRELAAQVRHELEWLGAPRQLRASTLYGGVGFGPQRAALRRGVDVVVACPGRLTDLVQQGDVDLGEVEIVVIDEADRMADMGFLPVVRRLLDRTPTTRQTMLFSATLDGPVKALWRRYQRDPMRYSVGAQPDQRSRATHVFWDAPRSHRLRLCADVVSAAGSTIVFCRTKRGTDHLARKLGALGVRTAAIHGNRSQVQRDRALRAFAGGQVEALVATDVAARGLHVDDVACVVHWDPPADATDYTHRSGRTARAGAAGVVVSLVSPEQHGVVAPLQKELGLGSRLTKPDTSVFDRARRQAGVRSRSGGDQNGQEPTHDIRQASTRTRSPGQAGRETRATTGTARRRGANRRSRVGRPSDRRRAGQHRTGQRGARGRREQRGA
jgi:superfamily II DNA/RNA helicase